MFSSSQHSATGYPFQDLRGDDCELSKTKKGRSSDASSQLSSLLSSNGISQQLKLSQSQHFSRKDTNVSATQTIQNRIASRNHSQMSLTYLNSGKQSMAYEEDEYNRRIQLTERENEDLRNENRRLSKENMRLTKLLEFAEISRQQKDTFFMKMVEQNIEIKSKLDDLSLHRSHTQQLSLLKLSSNQMKKNEIQEASSSSFPQPFSLSRQQPIQTQSKPKKSKPKSLQIGVSAAAAATSIIAASDHVVSRQPFERFASKRWTQMKHKLEQQKILSPNDRYQVLVQRPPSSQFKTKKSQFDSNSLQLLSSTNIPLTPLTPSSSSFISPSSNNFSSAKGFRALKHSRAPSQQASDLLERKNVRPLFIQHSTDNAFYASALDINISNITH